MKITTLPKEYQKARSVLQKIAAQGYEAYFVGGSVRDTLLGKPIHDVDIATSAFPAEIKAIFPRTVDIGIEHGTVLVLEQEDHYEITTFRTESTYQDFRRPDKVEFVRSLEEDLKRRDFTINAFALKEDGEVIDLFDGLIDLEEKVLRAVGNPQERFHEDALRMMRGLRFLSELGFELEPRTWQAMRENHALLGKISVERIYVEFVKLLLGEHRNRAIEMFVETECYLYCPGLREYGEALLRFADLSERSFKNEIAAWVVLMDQLKLSEDDIRPFLKAWKCSNETIRRCQIAYQGLQWRKSRKLHDLDLYRLGLEASQLVEGLQLHYQRAADRQAIQARYQELPIHSLKELAVNGRDLMEHFNRKGGEWLKAVLNYLEVAVVEKKVVNQQAALVALAETYLKEYKHGSKKSF